jgi:hypothetical protein
MTLKYKFLTILIFQIVKTLGRASNILQKTPLRLEHTILGKTATKKKPRNTQVQTGLYKEAATIQRLERFARS